MWRICRGKFETFYGRHIFWDIYSRHLTRKCVEELKTWTRKKLQKKFWALEVDVCSKENDVILERRHNKSLTRRWGGNALSKFETILSEILRKSRKTGIFVYFFGHFFADHKSLTLRHSKFAHTSQFFKLKLLTI